MIGKFFELLTRTLKIELMQGPLKFHDRKMLLLFTQPLSFAL